MPLPQTQKRYTYQDYLTWPDEERWEIIDGVAYDMSPAPSTMHQRISMQIATLVNIALRGKSCTPFAAPTDVYFSEEDVVQPDVFVVCDRNKIEKNKINGAPDLIFEILSPGTSRKDRWEKKELYERNGVREYILVVAESQYVEQYILQSDRKFDSGKALRKDEKLVLSSFDNLEMDLKEIFVFELDEKSPCFIVFVFYKSKQQRQIWGCLSFLSS